MSRDEPYRGMVMHYGGPPAPGRSPEDFLGTPVPTVTAYTIDPSPPIRPKQISASARVDEDGLLWLRVTVDGKHVVEVNGSATTVTLTTELT